MQVVYYWQDQYLYINVHVNPGAKLNKVIGEYGDKLKVQVSAPPNDGKANAALIKCLAAYFSVSLKQVSLIRGEHSQNKLICIANPKTNLEYFVK